MASLIHCPHCGVRPREEFTIRGDASVLRPLASESERVWSDYVYLRDNPMGRHKELWQHTAGCRRFLVVERDTVSHEVHSVRDAASERLGGAQ
jgi:sarcosine oxidase subunit delta